MKNSKRIISAVIAVLLAFTMAVPGFSEENDLTTSGKVQITMKPDDQGINDYATTQFYGYMLMGASVAKDENGNIIRAAYTVNPKYKEVLTKVTKALNSTKYTNVDPTDDEIIAYVASLKDNASGIRQYADTVYFEILQANIQSDAASTDDSTGKKDIFSGVAEGYWLIVGQKKGALEKPVDNTLVMLDTAGESSLEVTVKPIDEPGVTKQVYDGADKSSTTGEAGWKSAADYQIGDLVPFELTAKPQHPDVKDQSYDDFTSYYLKFTDTLSAGLDFYDPKAGNDKKLKVTAIDSEGKPTILTEVASTATEAEKKLGYVVSYTEGENGTHVLTIEFADLKSILINEKPIDPSYTIVVDYYATLNPKAEVLVPETNKVKITYSNDPYVQGSTATSPDQTVEVYTYGLVIDKKANDGTDVTKYLKGAEFALYKIDASGEQKPVGDSVRIKYYTIPDVSDGNTSLSDNPLDDNKNKTAVRFVFEGLDEGTYVLKEVTVPDGYNGIEDITFTITPNRVTGEHAADSVLPVEAGNASFVPYEETDGQFNKYYLYTTIENKTGLELPSTGGTGRTVLVLFGCLCALIAGVILVTNKRMKNES